MNDYDITGPPAEAARPRIFDVGAKRSGGIAGTRTT